MKNKKRILALTLAGTLLFSQGAAMTYAETVPTPKEEVVYANLAHDGSLSDVHVVNSFDGGSITDYGVYSSVRNMTTTDEIKQSGDVITIQTDADKIHYQGDLESANIPWDIDIKYFLDGNERTGEEIAGATGHLRMEMDITQNKGCPSNFWQGYAIQMTIKMDADRCENIVAGGANIANAGSNKQLTYIILPGQGADLTIEADVTDFEMESIAMNGINLHLDIDLDATPLAGSLAALENGAAALDKGAESVKTGAKEVKDGSATLKNGANSMEKGMNELFAGIAKIQKGVNKLDDKSGELTEGSATVYEALKTINDALAGVEASADDVDKLTEASTKVNDGIGQIVGGLEEMNAGIDTFYTKLEEGGLSGIDELLRYHELVAQFITITDTQRELFQVFQDNGGGITGGSEAAQEATMERLKEMAAAGDKEAKELYDEYLASGKDSEVISEYMTMAGAMVIVEELVAADIAYIEGTNQLITAFDEALDEEDNDSLMYGAYTLQEQYQIFDDSIQSLAGGLRTLLGNMDELKDGIKLLVDNYGELDAGITAYTEGVGAIVEGYGQIYKGAESLTNGATELSKGTNVLARGAVELYEGTDQLEEGTTELFTNVDGAGDKITKTITDTIDEMTGRNIKTASFVSSKNTNVESVLFVVKTPPIEKPAAPVEAEPAPVKLTFWQKIMNIFK